MNAPPLAERAPPDDLEELLPLVHAALLPSGGMPWRCSQVKRRGRRQSDLHRRRRHPADDGPARFLQDRDAARPRHVERLAHDRGAGLLRLGTRLSTSSTAI